METAVEERHISGWTWLFFAWIILGNFFAFLALVSAEIYFYASLAFPFNWIIGALEIASLVVFIAFGAYVVYSLYKFKPNAIPLVKLFLILLRVPAPMVISS